AAVKLESLFPFRDGLSGASLKNGRVGREECFAHRAGKRKGEVEAALGEVVEENAADATRLAAVAEKEVFVAPALEARIVGFVERGERLPAGRMEMPRVFLEAVVGGE